MIMELDYAKQKKDMVLRLHLIIVDLRQASSNTGKQLASNHERGGKKDKTHRLVS